MTLLRVVAGLVLALILGVPVGILMGLNRAPKPFSTCGSWSD